MVKIDQNFMGTKFNSHQLYLCMRFAGIYKIFTEIGALCCTNLLHDGVTFFSILTNSAFQNCSYRPVRDSLKIPVMDNVEQFRKHSLIPFPEKNLLGLQSLWRAISKSRCPGNHPLSDSLPKSFFHLRVNPSHRVNLRKSICTRLGPRSRAPAEENTPVRLKFLIWRTGFCSLSFVP